MRGKKFPLDFCDVYFYNISRKMSAEICVPGRSVDLPEFFLNFYTSESQSGLSYRYLYLIGDLYFQGVDQRLI